MAEIHINSMECDPRTTGIKAMSLEVHYGDKGEVAAILLRPAQLLTHSDDDLRGELRNLAVALTEAPILRPK